ncbi:MAG: tRNA 2-thiocytidine(32) synthetase TtcA [Myxococcales bacterium]|nr:tRNA 2-thiocytidine(32) synthetase TtcA [Myxococcales bacterium]
MEPTQRDVRTGVRLTKRLVDQVGRASKVFRLLEPGDRILCGLSGGKDSYAMIWLLREVLRKAPFDFELIAVNLDQGHPGFPQHVIRQWCEEEGFEHHMLHRDTFSVVKEKIPEGKTYCSLCSRLRRGILYNVAEQLGCTKIALGHHRDDVIETLMLNLMFSGQLKAMPPRLTSDDGRNVVIRPLVYCDEAEIAQFAQERAFPIVPCDLCGSQDNLQRQQIKRMLAEWSARNPKVKGSLFAALGNVRVSHLLDQELQQQVGMLAAERDPSVP